MSTSLVIVSVIGTLILAAGFGRIVWKLYEDKDRPDYNEVINYNLKRIPVQRGELMKVENSPTGRQILHIRKRDYSVRDVLNGIEPETYKIAIETKKLLDFPKGTWSPDKNVMVLLPEELTDIPEAMKKTSYGKALMQMTEDNNSQLTEIQMLKEGSTRKTALLKDIGDGELSLDKIKQLEEIQQQAFKSMTQSKDNKLSLQSLGDKS